MKIVILEGLPLVGKTTILKYINSFKINNIHTVDELILDTIELNQLTFMNNDLKKISLYNDGLVIIDRGLISTLSYNQMLQKLGNNKNLSDVINWFNKYGKTFYEKDNVYTYYLKKESKKLRNYNPLEPNGSIENQIELENITLNNIRKYCKNYEIVNYDDIGMEEFANEIINKHL